MKIAGVEQKNFGKEEGIGWKRGQWSWERSSEKRLRNQSSKLQKILHFYLTLMANIFLMDNFSSNINILAKNSKDC